jgi:lincosamide nucleotidyltransferase A/C/D/E
MTGHDVLRVLDALHVNGVSPVIEGGWGVDALLGRQTRAHGDVDLVITAAEREATYVALEVLGYDQVTQVAAGRTSISQRDGRALDLHIIDAELVQHTSEGPFRYPESMLQGRGLIVGRPIRCLTAEGQVLTHADHDVNDTARADLFLLADQLGARLYFPLTRGTDINCRDATEADLPAMAAVTANARQSHPISQVPATKTLTSDIYWRYWHQRLAVDRTVALVVTVGEAVTATVAIGPWQASDLSKVTTAALYGLATHESAAADQLDELLLAQARQRCYRDGYLDLRTWIDPDDHATRALFERSGWSPDGATHEIVPGLTRIRYVAR